MDNTTAKIFGGCLIASAIILAIGMYMSVRLLGVDLQRAGGNARTSVNVPHTITHKWDTRQPLRIEVVEN